MTKYPALSGLLVGWDPGPLVCTMATKAKADIAPSAISSERRESRRRLLLAVRAGPAAFDDEKTKFQHQQNQTSDSSSRIVLFAREPAVDRDWGHRVGRRACFTIESPCSGSL
jgi:hypothetical protein